MNCIGFEPEKNIDLISIDDFIYHIMVSTNESSFIVNRVDFLGSAISDWVDNLGFAIHFGNGWKWLHINENILS